MKATIVVVGAVVFAAALSGNYVNTAINNDVRASITAKRLEVVQLYSGPAILQVSDGHTGPVSVATVQGGSIAIMRLQPATAALYN